MLDDLKLIHERDKADALGIVEKQWQQLAHEFTLRGEDAFSTVDNVVYAAMGGSAFAASLLPVWPAIHRPFEIVRGYDLPSYVSGNTLVIVSSYSGNTEETLSCLEQAQAKGAQIAVITAGGQLHATATERGYLLAELPKTAQPRYAALYNFKALLQILEEAGLLHADDYAADLQKAVESLKSAVAAWRPDVAASRNPAKQLALELMGKSVVVYAGPKMSPAAYKWKIDCNENAIHVAWTNQLPEFSHNEFAGWTKQPVDKPYAVVDLRSSLEHERIQKRFDVTARLLSGIRPEPHVVEARGKNLIEQLLYLVAYGDFVSLYLAILNGVDPAPLEIVDKFKKEMEN